MASRCGTYTVTVNIICEGLLLLALSSLRSSRGRGKQSAERRRGHDEEVASSKENEFKTRVQNRHPMYDQNGGKMASLDTLFMTKTAEKPHPLGLHIPPLYSPYKGVPPGQDKTSLVTI